MEAKVLRAALSAALRVTVSTGLVGCGGATSDGGPRTGTATTSELEGGDTTPSPRDEAGAAGGSPASGAATSEGLSGGAAAGGAAATGGLAGTGASELTAGSAGTMTAQGGAPLAGASSGGAAGAGGAKGSAWACEDLNACVELLTERLAASSDPLPDDATTVACCGAMIEPSWPPSADLQCTAELLPRSWPTQAKCCELLRYPRGPVCTPWGPPVPPEFGREQLLLWEATA